MGSLGLTCDQVKINFLVGLLKLVWIFWKLLNGSCWKFLIKNFSDNFTTPAQSVQNVRFWISRRISSGVERAYVECFCMTFKLALPEKYVGSAPTLAIQPPPATADQHYEHSRYRHHLLLQINRRGIGLLLAMSHELKKLHSVIRTFWKAPLRPSFSTCYTCSMSQHWCCILEHKCNINVAIFGQIGPV
jgi:hypothetical protein